MPTPSSRIRKVLLACIATLVALAIGELGMRRVMCHEAGVESFELARESYVGARLKIFSDTEGGDPCRALVPGSKVENQISINSLGFRGHEVSRQKPPAVLRAICLGGSSVFGTASSNDASTWPAELERLCAATPGSRRVEVVNAGVPGFTSTQSVGRFVGCCLALAPDVAILCNELNDPLRRRMHRLAHDPRRYAPVPTDTPLARVLSNSAIYLRLRAGLTFAQKSERLSKAVAHADGDAAAGAPVAPVTGRIADQDPAIAAQRDEVFRALARDNEEGGTPYFLPEDLEAYRGNLRRFVTSAREQRCVPVLATEPLSFLRDADVDTYRSRGSILALYFPDHERFRAMVAEYDKVLFEVAAETGTLIVDSDRVMSHAPEHWQDFVHTNDAGSREMAKMIREFLVANRIVP